MLNQEEKKLIFERHYDDDFQLRLEKIKEFERQNGKNSADEFWFKTNDDDSKKEWKGLFLAFVSSKADVSEINTIKPLKKNYMAGDDPKVADYWFEKHLPSENIIMVDSKNPIADRIVNECNSYGFFVQIFGKIGECKKYNSFSCVSYSLSDFPRTRMIERSDAMVLLKPFSNFDSVCRINPNITIENAYSKRNEEEKKAKDEKNAGAVQKEGIEKSISK